jgi:hypothetical protein
MTEVSDIQITPSATPRVLTKNVIPTLTQGLDASDILEVYALVRDAPLHGIANSTLHIQKMALGVRYRPSGVRDLKEPMELTLEYGPQRMGPSFSHEAVPFVQVEDTSSFIAWDNVGKVYYTTKIVTQNYLSSYYMASMTGAVLDKILAQAVDYSERRRRYQPFAVYSSENKKELKSSSGADFTQFMWKHLAMLGVEIEPILPPPVYEARLWVSSWQKVIPEAAVAQAAATYYQKLYQCLESIATNDYGAYIPSALPTVSPAPTPGPTQQRIPSAKPSEENANTGEEAAANPSAPDSNSPMDKTNSTTIPDADSNVPADDSATDADGTEDETAPQPEDGVPENEPSENKDESQGENDDDISPSDDSNHLDEDNQTSDNGDNRLRYMRRRLDEDEIFDDDIDDGSEKEEEDSEINDVESLDVKAVSEESANKPSALGTATPTPTELEPPALPSSGQDVEKAQQAAQEAQIAADEAENAATTEEDTKSAEAAQVAAHAAQAAADATSDAAAQAAMDGLLSGDGAVMSSIASTCFSNPQYDIASVDENGTVTSEAYLYRDGSLYYKLNLTSPYLEVVKVNRPLPKVVLISDYGSGGDFVDWVLALAVLGLVALTVVVILQQMGYQYIASLFRCQRWFFNPRKYDYEGNAVFVEDEEGAPFRFGQDSIPLSMGGRVSPRSRRNVRPPAAPDVENDSDVLVPELSRSGRSDTEPSSSARPNSNNGFGEVELSTIPSRMRPARAISRSDSQGSLSDEDFGIREGPVLPERLARDPNLVDLPDLKSKSKVAVPVGGNGSRLHSQRPSSRSSSMDDDSRSHASSNQFD